jgi:hypothetical protein
MLPVSLFSYWLSNYREHVKTPSDEERVGDDGGFGVAQGA